MIGWTVSVLHHHHFGSPVMQPVSQTTHTQHFHLPPYPPLISSPSPSPSSPPSFHPFSSSCCDSSKGNTVFHPSGPFPLSLSPSFSLLCFLLSFLSFTPPSPHSPYILSSSDKTCHSSMYFYFLLLLVISFSLPSPDSLINPSFLSFNHFPSFFQLLLPLLTGKTNDELKHPTSVFCYPPSLPSLPITLSLSLALCTSLSLQLSFSHPNTQNTITSHSYTQ